MEEINRGFLTGERALFASRGIKVTDSIFADGESPLKESRDVELSGCMFKWKYPLWYCENVSADKCTWFETARSGVWYTNHICVTDCQIEAPKNFRRCDGVTLKNVTLPNAAETLWSCKNVIIENVVASKADYFAMNGNNIKANNLTLYGNYSFDGASNIEIHNSTLLSKDAFWNTNDVTVYDSVIYGEYLGWNAKNLTLVNCSIESLQGLCYIDNLKLINCKLINTTLAFEYSSVEADISGKIDSVFNPSSGRITADSIDELILQKDKVDTEKTVIICRKKEL